MRVLLAIALVPTICLVLPDRTAHACAPPGPYPRERLVIKPDPGASRVPTNTRVLLRLDGSLRDGYEVRLRPLGGDVVTAAFSVAFRDDALVVPAAPLEPETTYEILDNARLGCAVDTDCFGAEFNVVSSFTTGSAPDLAAPVLPSDPSVTDVEHWVSMSSCGFADAMLFRLTWAEGIDDSPLWYEVVDQDGEAVSARLLLPSGNGSLDCIRGSFSFNHIKTSNSGEYRVRATDLSGNATESAPLSLGVTCPIAMPMPDAGPSNDANGGAAEADVAGSAGCQVGRGRSTTSLVIVLALSRLLVRRGRRSRAS